jgi:hypothetical protein
VRGTCVEAAARPRLPNPRPIVLTVPACFVLSHTRKVYATRSWREAGPSHRDLQAEQTQMFRTVWEGARTRWRDAYQSAAASSRWSMMGQRSQIAPERTVVFGGSYCAVQDMRVEQLTRDTAVAEADTPHLTVPNHLGVSTISMSRSGPDRCRPSPGLALTPWGHPSKSDRRRS